MTQHTPGPWHVGVHRDDPMTYKFEIKRRFTGDVLFTADLPADNKNKPLNYQLGEAVKLANLVNANLRGANLVNANLRGANLRGADLIDGGHDARGYRFWAWWHADGHFVYRAGCQEWHTIEAAIAHYGGGYKSDGNVAACLARLDVMQAEIDGHGAPWPE